MPQDTSQAASALAFSGHEDVLDPEAFAHMPPRWHAWPIVGWLDRWFSDKRLNISRPKLLFATSVIDLTTISALGFAFAGAAENSAWTITSILTVALLCIVMFSANWVYSVSSLSNYSRQLEKIIRSMLTVFCVWFGATALAGWSLLDPSQAAVWLAVSLAALGLIRLGLSAIIGVWSTAGRLVRRTVIVGGGPQAEALIKAVDSDPSNQINILGIFDDRDDERSSDAVAGRMKLGNFDQLAQFCRNAAVDLIVVTVPMRAETRLLQILERLMPLPAEVRISALGSQLRLNASAYRYIGSVPVLAVMDRPLSDWDRVIKNLEDRVLGAVLLLAASPVMLACAIAVKLDSRGPVVFKQRRFGFNNELVEVFKFRSMYTDMTDASAQRLVTKDDPRVTRVGHFLRKSSLDELPQLINVVRGEMSLVGPRPHATQAKADGDLYQSVVDGYFQRHRMKPGITGWAQINGWRGETDTHEKIEQRVNYDLEYIDRWSLLFDLYIIARTPLALLSARNAY